MTFDLYVAVDWSGAAAPRTGKDSIWIASCGAEGEVTTENPSTRAEAMRRLSALVAGKRALVGFDFAFGYPSDAKALPDGGAWKGVWLWLRDNLRDGDRNENDRFAVASDLNARFKGNGPFWGHPHQHAGRYGGLQPKRPDYEKLGVRERRHVETIVPRAQPVWKLAYAGSVGGQALLGIARLETWRRELGARGAVWPFETGFADDLSADVLVVEIYPSLWPVARSDGTTLDEAQVRAVAELFRRHARDGRLSDMLSGPNDPAWRAEAMSHEGWIYGVRDTVLKP